MTVQPSSFDIEPLIWARLLGAQQSSITPEIARYLLSINFGESDHERMQYLADRSECGTLEPEEEAEFDGYLHVGNILAVMQSKARVVLGEQLSNSVNS